MLLIIIIILLLLIIKMIRPATDAKPDSTAAVSTESLAPETEAETVAAESLHVWFLFWLITAKPAG